MKRSLRAAALAALVYGRALYAQSEPPVALVERVDIQGNQYMQKDTLLFYVQTKAGEQLDEIKLKEDFRRLWATGFLEDMTLQVLDGRQGKVVVFRVQERKRVQIVDYRGTKAITTSNIDEKLKEKEAQLRIDSFYDLAKARRVEAIIKEMLDEKGRPFATVTHTARTLGGAGVQVTFNVDEGPKAKVKSITFTGNERFSDGKLRGQMKEVKQTGFWNWTWLLGKTTYTRDKWGEDQEKIREFYLNEGYVQAQVGEPKLSYTDGKAGTFKKKPVKHVHIEIPVTEGEQFRVGDVKVEGMTVFQPDLILPIFKIKSGEIYKESRIKKGYEKLRDAYGAQGYFQWTALTQRNPDPERKVVDLVLKMEEDKRYFVGRINFTGNETTRDKVIRREVYLTEGDVFNTELLKLSIKRINQLGYFKAMEGIPQLTQSSLGDDKLDVTLKVEEQNRNQFTFGGGVSGLEGAFINAAFSTSNFLGLGETFSVSAQSGRRTKVYQIAVTEPYFLDRPITAGVDIYKRRLEYQTYAGENLQGYIDDRTGFSLMSGVPLGRFSRLFASYAYEVIRIEISDDLIDPDQVFDPTVPIINNPFQEDLGRRRESRLTPSLVYNTVDNPYTPRAGWKVTSTFQLTGGPLGGTLDYLRPSFETIYYKPHLRKTALGLRAEIAYIRPFNETAEINPINGLPLLPFYQRYFMGGENQIRGYNLRTVGPRDENGYAIGGNKSMLFNAEYYWDIAGPLRFLLFFDAGQAFLEGQPYAVNELRTSTGAELRFIMPVLNVPFRLIYAWNPHRDEFQPRTTFKFAVGTTF